MRLLRSMPTFPSGRRGRWRPCNEVRPPLFHPVCSLDGVTDLFFGFLLIHPYMYVVVVVCIISCDPPFVSIVSTSCWRVVFNYAGAFNADISKWQTGQVTMMVVSTSTSVPHLLWV